MRAILWCTALVLPALACANTTTHTKTELVQSRQQFSAKSWGLTESQWQRYETLMQSPLTYDMASDSPLEVLAQFARTPEERRELAEKLVEFDKKRTEGLLALDIAYREAWKRLYPNMPVVQGALPARVVLFVSERCSACLDALKAWRSKGVAVDVYLVGAKGDDSRLRQWAADAGIRQNDVLERHITLNHDTRGLWFAFAKGQPTPVAIRQQGEQWSVIALP